MKRLIIYLAWAWEIIVGALLITPGGIICIACGATVQAPGYIGETATRVVGVVAVVLGLYGIANVGRAGASAAGGA
ncbi:MAG TPA: hypothetical protein VMT20_04450 [Terriglobia bacterium]|nr:hypothetical protein [Terriglobia bacterium]